MSNVMLFFMWFGVAVATIIVLLFLIGLAFHFVKYDENIQEKHLLRTKKPDEKQNM